MSGSIALRFGPTPAQADVHGGLRLVNTRWRHAVRLAAILAVAIGFPPIGRPDQPASAQSNSPPPLTGGVQAIPDVVVAQEERPRLFRAPSGQLFRVWNRVSPTGAGDVVIATSADGRSWQPWPDLRPDVSGVRAHDGRLAVNGSGEVALAYRWTRPRAVVKHVRVATSSGPTAWALPTDNLDSSGGAADPHVAWGAGRTLVVVWADSRRQRRVLDIYVRRSPDAGATWESEVLISPPAAAQDDVRFHSPRLLGDGNGRFWLLWIDAPAGRATLRLRRSEDDGRTWSPPQDLSGAGRAIYGHSLHRAGNRLLLTWQDQRPAPGLPHGQSSSPNHPARVYASASSDGGATWTSPVQVDSLPAGSPVSATEPSSALTPSGEAWLAWHDTRNGRHDVFVARSPDGGATWGAPLRLDADAPGTAESRMPRLAVSPDGTKVAVVWEDDRRGREAIYGRFLSAGQWSDETRLGPVLPPKKAAAGPHVEAVGKDSFYIVWQVFDYSVGNSPVRSGMDDTVVVSR
jgi:BNR repeat-like domain